MNGDALTLRPEAPPASCALDDRAQRALQRPAKAAVVYIGPDVPPRAAAEGRYRQFFQLGVEALGFAGPDVDAELILMARRLWATWALVGETCGSELNSLGQPDERRAPRALIAYISRAPCRPAGRGRAAAPAQQPAAHPGHQEPGDAGWWGRAAADGLPGRRRSRTSTRLRGHARRRRPALRLNPRLVRGLDYYNLTVFEWVTDHLGCAGHGVRRWALRRPVRADRRQSRRRRSAGAWASSGC